MTADELARAFAGESLPEPMDDNRPSLDRWFDKLAMSKGGYVIADSNLGPIVIDFATGELTNADIVYQGRKLRNDGGPSHHSIHTAPQWVEHNTERTRALLKEQLQGRTFRFPTNDHEI